MNNNYTSGVSVIICCYNSSLRIANTLKSLAQQQCKAKTFWEIILVDNASTDNTSEVALQIWEELKLEVIMRIVFEPLPGLSNARRKGISEASYSVILFCDDDNWLSQNYVQGVLDILESDSNIAACGGMGIPVFETAEPFWFYKYAEAFALGSQEINFENGELLNLYGAGLAVQKKVVDELYQSGFDSILKDRIGQNLSSSGDTELTYSFVLMGYKLFCTDELKFFHYLPKERLTFDYLKKLFIAFGTDGPVRNLYYAYISKRFFHKLIKYWGFHLVMSLFRFIKYLIIPPKKFGRVIYFNWSIAYIRQLLLIKRYYPQLNTRIAKIKRNRPHPGIKNIAKSNSLLFEKN